MGVLRYSSGGSWCFCTGAIKSERIKGSIYSSKSPAMASISGGGTGFFIQRNLLLTTHVNIPSVAAAEEAEVRIHRGKVLANIVPHRFFITSSVLDLTIVGIDTVESDSISQFHHQPHFLKTCGNMNLDLGSTIYLLGHAHKKELSIGEGKVVIATDNLIKLSADGLTWSPGSAGFDSQGNLAFMVCDPMKLAKSPILKSSAASDSVSSSSSLSLKSDSPMQFGIPIPIIRDWLHQHWEGNLDELSKPKLPLIRLMSSGQKSEYSSASFTHRHIFKPEDVDNDNLSSSSLIASKPRFQVGSNNSANVDIAHESGIPTPEIFESPNLTSGKLRKAEKTPTQLLDINFPVRIPTSIALPLPLKQMLIDSNMNNHNNEHNPEDPVRKYFNHKAIRHESDCCSEVMSSSSPLENSRVQNDIDGFSSGEETMYSAETMESTNMPSPNRNKHQQVGRSRSCVNYNRWDFSQQNSSARKGAALKKQQSMISMRKTRSQSTSLPQRSHDYFSPTVSSSMKKRNSLDQPLRHRQSNVQASPRVMRK